VPRDIQTLGVGYTQKSEAEMIASIRDVTVIALCVLVLGMWARDVWRGWRARRARERDYAELRERYPESEGRSK
jgi:hypothetical protein